MRKKFFDFKLSQFSKYLNEIGILSGLDTEQFQKQFYEISSDIYNSNDISSNDYNVNYIYFKETISNALVYFIKTLSEEKLKLTALNIFMKYSLQEEKIKEKLLKLFKIFSKQYLSIYFTKWKLNNKILINELDRTISSHILSNNISNFQNHKDQKYLFEQNDNRENNATNDITFETYNNFKNNILRVNNSMANLNSQILNISIAPEIYNNNHLNNNSYYENSLVDNIINNYTYERKTIKQKNLGQLNNTYSTNYYNPKTYFNNNKNANYNPNKNYMNKTNYNINYKYQGKSANSKLNNNYSLNTSKSKELNVSKIKHKVNLDYLNNLSKSKTEHNLIPERTTQYLKEQEELNNFCTFKPKINKSSSFSRYNYLSNKKSIDRLYLDSKNRIARKEMEALKKSNLESKENTFQPKFISSSVKKVKSDFKQRLKDFENIKKNKIQKISTDLENEEKQQFTFSPKINTSINKNRNNNIISNKSKTSNPIQNMLSKKKKIPAYKRLYDENRDKKIRQEARVNLEIEKIRKNSSKISENSNFDTKKIEELYNDFKNKKSRLKTKQKEIEKEQGITFKPELISEKKYYDKINPDFYEREKLFLEKQHQNIESYKLSIHNEENKRKKKYNEEEKKEIYSNIVSRLYKEGVEKYMQKRNKGINIDDNNSNNGNILKCNLIIKNKNIKNESEVDNKIKDIKNEFEFEKEPEEEIFKPNYRNYGNFGNNNDFLTNADEKNIYFNHTPLDFTKSESTN